jgi:flagellar basal body P-ring formation protein FlgA
MTKYQRKLTQHSLKTIGMMSLQSLSALLLFCFALFYLLGLTDSAQAASLRSLATVENEHVKLGDLFDGVNNPNNIVGKAPRLGKEMLITTDTLRSIAKKYQVNWTPTSTMDQVIIRRASYTISTDDIITSLKDKIIETAKSDNITVTLNDPNLSVTLPMSVTPTIEVTSLNFSQNREVFTAQIAIPDKLNPVITKQVIGTVTRSVSVPVLKATMKKSDIISANDIDYINVPERALLTNAVVDADDLIGMSPDRVITAGRVIKDNDISSPQLVKRGDEVLIQYDSHGMLLTAKGKATQNGAKGDFIRVTNGSSAKQMTAEVVGNREVMVR